ncbi:hypothetical protein C8F04DRAFT_1199503 [Mycena alexandri]|uniref:Uncharacterized protein n=1 Tax=Mycena alexandri TaxID=1745969 RepID=A0AAD6WMG7_9AGAR|nr:hypothetical protein C8F04DRAFT_1199503 [Mycena alexandri]
MCQKYAGSHYQAYLDGTSRRTRRHLRETRETRRGTRQRFAVTLKKSDSGIRRGSYYQGVKICPHSDVDNLTVPHTSASRANIQTWLRQDREDRLQYASPSKDIFCRTAAYLAALRKLGCSRPSVEETLFSESEEEQNKILEIYREQLRALQLHYKQRSFS